MPDVINDALAISQHVVQHLGIDAVQYLLGIEQLTIEQWREAYFLLEIGSQNRTTKEAFIKAIAEHFVEDNGDTSFCVRNLSLLPGFQKTAIELYSYTASTLHAIQHVTQTIADKRLNAAHADLANFNLAPTHTISPTSCNQQGEPPKTQPRSYSGALKSSSLAPTDGFTPVGSQQNSNSSKRLENTWRTRGWTYSKDETINNKVNSRRTCA